MRTISSNNTTVLPLGKQGENLAEKIIFCDPVAWTKEYGTGTVQLLNQRPGEDTPYPVAIAEEADGSYSWVVTAADTALAGQGKCELRYLSGDTVVKSHIWSTIVNDALGEPSDTPPESQQGWVDQVLAAGTSAQEAAKRAEDAAARQPYPNEETGTWWVWDAEAGAYKDTGISYGVGGSSVELDTTLKEAGKAADAKAVGDAISTLSEEIVELDTTLSFSGKAADAKAVGDALNKVTAGVVVGRFFGKVANFLGDSQTGDAGNYKSVFFYDWLKDILGLSATNNYGYSGTTIMPIEGQTSSFLERYTSMSDDADLIVVWGGTNDYHYGHALGAVDDTENTTFCGALNNLCKGLIAKYPQKSILFVTPTPRGNIASAVATQKEYADAIIDVCAKYCIPVFDAFRKCNMPIIVDSDRRYTADGLHLNDLGHEILGKSMANFILYGPMAGCQSAFGTGSDTVVAVNGVTLSNQSATIEVGGTIQLTATVEPFNASDKSVVWSTSNESVATVNDGLVKGIAYGTAIITVKTVSGNKTATCTVTVDYGQGEETTSPVDGKTITFTSACVHTPNMSNIICLVSADDLANKSGAVVIEAKISNATQTITGGHGMSCYQDESGEVGNNAFKTPSVATYVQTTVDGDTITATTTYEPDKLSYPYVKFPLSFTPGAYPVSFYIVSLTLSIGGEYVPIQKVGAFTANEGYSES